MEGKTSARNTGNTVEIEVVVPFFFHRKRKKSYQAYHNNWRDKGPNKVIFEGHPATTKKKKKKKRQKALITTKNTEHGAQLGYLE